MLFFRGVKPNAVRGHHANKHVFTCCRDYRRGTSGLQKAALAIGLKGINLMHCIKSAAAKQEKTIEKGRSPLDYTLKSADLLYVQCEYTVSSSKCA